MTRFGVVHSGAMSDPYTKFLDMKISLRDVHSHFHTYSAQDVKKLLAAKMKSVREPKALQQLYELERAIVDLRLALEEAKTLPAKPPSESPAP